jgi:pimeloyl-ACP methyl ester carboxylesterase
MRLHIRDEHADGPQGAVVLIHGLGLDLTSWDRVVPGLIAAGHRAVRLDLRGHGGSSGPGYTLGDLAGDVVATLDDLGIERAHLVGHSLGGTVLVEAALHAPGRVSSLSVLGGIIAGAPATAAFVHWAEQVTGLAKEGLAALQAGLPDTLMYRNRVGVRIRPALHDASFVEENFASAYAAATAPRTSWDRLRDGELAAPVLLLNGVDDAAFATTAAESAAQVPGATGVDLAAGHLTILEQPQAVAAHLVRAFERVRR